MILSERAMKNELKDTYSFVQKGQKIKSEQSNGDYQESDPINEIMVILNDPTSFLVN